MALSSNTRASHSNSRWMEFWQSWMSPNFFSVQICPSKSDADSELISDRNGNSEIASRMRSTFSHTFKNPSPLSLLASRVDKYYVSHNPLNTSSESFGHRPPIAAWPTLCLDHPVPLECLLGDYRASTVRLTSNYYP